MSGDELEIFSQEWAEKLGAALNSSAEYRSAAATWEGSLVFAQRAAGAGPDRGAYLDLSGGLCRTARRATTEDLESSDYLLRADTATWRKLLNGETDPMFALMLGQLELARGSIADLLPQAAAAKQLVRTAVGIGGRFPDEPS